MYEHIYGIVPPMTTPFREDGSIDEDALRAETRYMVDTAKVHGVAVCGSTGEGHTLTTEETRRITEVVVHEARGRVPVITGIITDGTAPQSSGASPSKTSAWQRCRLRLPTTSSAPMTMRCFRTSRRWRRAPAYPS